VKVVLFCIILFHFLGDDYQSLIKSDYALVNQSENAFLINLIDLDNFFLSKQNSYLCNQLGNALFCVTSGIFAGRAQRDPAKSHELHKIAFPKVLHTKFFLILTKKSFFKR
jgi:hypothetical protein